MVSDEPNITDDSLPENESTPFASNILLTIANAPEPETGLSSANDKTSAGIPMTFRTGDRIFAKKSKSPEALTIETATTNPTKVGSIEKQDLAPRLAPAKNVSKIGTFFTSPKRSIPKKVSGKMKAVR